MQKDRPRLSIGLPVYNGEAYLAQALDSILAQSFEDFELIIADNASTDHTPAIIQDYASQDRRIRVQRNEQNIGAAPNFNLTFELARGEYFKWAAHDDVLDPRFFERCIDVLDHDQSIVLCYSRVAQIDELGNQTGNYDYPMNVAAARPVARFHDLVLVEHFCIAIFGIHRRDVLLQTPLIDSFVGSDRTLLAELALRGRFCELPEYLFFRREHADTSGRAYPVHRRLQWFDPKQKKKIYLPYWKTGLEFFKAANRVPLGFSARLASDQIVLKWFFSRRKQLINDFKAVIVYTFPKSLELVHGIRKFSSKKA